MRRKILMGVLAVALPLGTMAIAQSSAVAGAPSNPINCNGGITGGVINFAAGGLSSAGYTTSSKTGNPTTVTSATLHCDGSVTLSTPALSIAGGKNAKTSTKHVYQEGTFAEFIAAGGGLKKSLKSLPIAGGTFKVKSSSEGLCPADSSETGFVINGQVKGGTYPTKSAVLTVCLGTDTATGAGTTGEFGHDFGYPTANITAAAIDPATSSAVL